MEEIKRRILILRLSNQDKLLSKIGIKYQSRGKFSTGDEVDEHSDYTLKLMEILEIS